MPPKARRTKIEEAGEILKAFQTFDKNGDGFINREELATLLQTLDKAAWTQRKITSLMRVIDKDRNGKIDYDEFVRWMMGGPSADKDRKAVMSVVSQADSSSKGAPEQAPEATTAEKLVADAEGQAELDRVLKLMFEFYDEDGDGQIERIEMLDGEEKRIGKLDFGPKARKATIEWFKQAGAEGTPVAGMYLSEEKWRVAVVKSAAEEAGIDASAEPGKLAAWFRENRAKLLEDDNDKSAATGARASGTESKEDAPAKSPPTYPLTCDLKEVAEKINEAASFQRAVLVLSSGLDEVETYLSYRMNSLLDCKQIISETLVKKSKSTEEAQADARQALTKAMNSSGFCKPLHVRLNNSAFDFTKFCCDDFPAEVFNPKVWTIDNAFNRGFFDNGHKLGLEAEDGKKWKDFFILITSSFDLEKAKEYLCDKIPSFEDLAIIIVDPASVK